MQTKLCFLDVETTGTDPNENGIIQIAGIIDIDGKEMERFNFQIKPFECDIIKVKALGVNGITMNQIEKYPSANVVYPKFLHILDKYVEKFDRLDKFHFCAYNAIFDDSFMRAWFQKNNDQYYGSWFYWPPLDVAQLVAWKNIEQRSKFQTFKLMAVAERSGIEIDESRAHDALYDIEVTRQLYYKLK